MLTRLQGEGTVYFYEIVDEAPYAHFLNKYVSTTPAVGMATLHKTMMDVKEVEIMHMLKLTTSGVDPTSFKVPRTRVRSVVSHTPAFVLKWHCILLLDPWRCSRYVSFEQHC